MGRGLTPEIYNADSDQESAYQSEITAIKSSCSHAFIFPCRSGFQPTIDPNYTSLTAVPAAAVVRGS